jgi:hypothetical protein
LHQNQVLELKRKERELKNRCQNNQQGQGNNQNSGNNQGGQGKETVNTTMVDKVETVRDRVDKETVLKVKVARWKPFWK